MSRVRQQLVALVDPNLFAQLKALSERSRVPMSEHVRQALREYLAATADTVVTAKPEKAGAA